MLPQSLDLLGFEALVAKFSTKSRLEPHRYTSSRAQTHAPFHPVPRIASTFTNARHRIRSALQLYSSAP